MLSARRDVEEVVALAALEHHERTDGKGYPAGKRADQINEISRLVSIVDVYDAVTSQRSYRPARSHHDALGVLWRGRLHKFDRIMVETFIHFLGWVAPGTLVRLSNGELAVVEETNIAQGFYPACECWCTAARDIDRVSASSWPSCATMMATHCFTSRMCCPTGCRG